MSPTFNCRIIFVHEVTLDQLNREARLSDTAASDNDELVFSLELQKTGRIGKRLDIFSFSLFFSLFPSGTVDM